MPLTRYTDCAINQPFGSAMVTCTESAASKLSASLRRNLAGCDGLMKPPADASGVALRAWRSAPEEPLRLHLSRPAIRVRFS